MLAIALGIATLMSADKFESNWDSLKKFECPEWFRDAKFGIWSHWGPQAVPMIGDWYAREMYREGTRQFKHHQEVYGHQGKFGYKDIIPMWKAEKWDPEQLMKLYKRAGAKYFVSMGVHHDNFDLWNSKHQRWNSVSMGPKRDVVGDWQRAAKKNGLKFGVSEHLAASFTWWQASHLSDKGGAFDGADPKLEDLYHWKAEAGDTEWYTKDQKFHAKWYDRISDLVSTYKPDLLYSDGGTPFGQVGRQAIADLYNQAPGQKVYLCKDMGSGEYVDGSCVLDRERGGMAGMAAKPWQTDTSIGDWYYNKNWPYRKAEWVIHTLVDVVSKNGNMLLNVVQRPDGSLDEPVVTLLEDIGKWMDVHGEAIFGTRPWLTFGEGPTKVAGGHFKEDFPFGARDIRFTRKGKNILYATLLGWPESETVNILSLSKLPEVTGVVKKVSMLGSKEKLEFEHKPGGLFVKLPTVGSSKIAISLKIECDDVDLFRPDLIPPPPRESVVIDGSGFLEPGFAEIDGSAQVEQRGGKGNFGFWDNSHDSINWLVSFKKRGTYRITSEAAALAEGSVLKLEIAKVAKQLEAKIPVTGDWGVFKDIEFGTVSIPAPGNYLITVTAANRPSWKPINLRGLSLKWEGSK